MIMATATFTQQKYDIISWITGLENRKLIRELHHLATTQKKTVSLSDIQKHFLQMSDEDIKNGYLISEEELNDHDEKWLY
jgi:hypothetical protein